GNFSLTLADEQDQTQGVTLGDDWRSHSGGIPVSGVRDKEAALSGMELIDFSPFHNLLHFRAQMFAQKITLAPTSHGDDGIPVTDRHQVAGAFAESLAELGSEVLQSAHQGVFLKDHFAIPAGIDLQWVTVTDNIGMEHLVRMLFCL